jgi:hypothetical protein
MQSYDPFALQQSQGGTTPPSSGRGQADDSDPLAVMYGGNIAAACEATNQSVNEGKEEELDADKEKKRQRASNRLTAWQSRERKRIELEVMKERKAELTKQNEDLQRENEQLRRVIQQVKEAKRIGGGAAASRQNAAIHAVAASNFAKMQQQQQQANMRFPFPASNLRRELPHLSMPSDDRGVGSSSLLPVRLLQHGANAAPPYIQQGVGPTIFAPLARQHLQQQQQQQQQQQLHQAFQLNNMSNSMPPNMLASHSGRGGALEMPYFRTLAHPSTKRRDAEEEKSTTSGSPAPSPHASKKSRKEL